MAILRTAVIGLLAVSAYASVLLSGTGSAAMDFDVQDFQFQLIGPGVSIFGQISNSEGLEDGCPIFCEFGASVSYFDLNATIGSATIGSTTSQNFMFDLQQVGTSPEFIGSLTLYLPFPNLTCCTPSDPVIASANIETFLTSQTTTGVNSFYGLETDYSFSTVEPAPEPGSWPVLLLAIYPFGRAISRLKLRKRLY